MVNAYTSVWLTSVDALWREVVSSWADDGVDIDRVEGARSQPLKQVVHRGLGDQCLLGHDYVAVLVEQGDDVGHDALCRVMLPRQADVVQAQVVDGDNRAVWEM